MLGLTALVILLAMPSCIQATASPSQVKASVTSISPNIQTQASSNASSNTSQVAVSSTNTSLPLNFTTNVIQVSTDQYTGTILTSVAALPTSSAMNARVTSNAVSILVNSMATSMGSKSISILPTSSYSGNVTNVTATSSSNLGSNSTNSVVSVVGSSTAPGETSTVNQKATTAITSTTALTSKTPTTSKRSSSHTSRSNSTSSAIAVTQSDSIASTALHTGAVSSAENTSQSQATATKTTIASYTTQSPSTGGSLQSPAPSLQTYYSALGSQLGASSAGNVTVSASQQTATTVNATSTLAYAIPTSPEATATSAAILLGASSLLSPTLGIKSSTEIASPPPSLTDPQSTLVHRSPSLPARSETNTVTTSFLVDSITVSVSNSSSTASFPINSSSSITTTTTSPTPRPTPQQEGTKIVSMEITLDLEFIVEYNDPKTQEYQELETNLTRELRKAYEKVDGFVDIRILFFKSGSVICSYIVILAKNSQVKHEKLTKIVEQEHRDGTFAFKVKSVKVEEGPTDGSTKKPDEKLPEWALITMIVLGSLTFIFLMIVICVCVKYRRTISGESDTYYVPSAELGMHTYETVTMSDIKTRANTNDKNSTAQRRLVTSHTNPTYGYNGAKAD